MAGAPIVFATPWPPWPLDNGTRIRTARLAQGLAQEFELTLVTFDDSGPEYDETRASRADLEALLPEARIELVPYAPPLRAGPQIGGLESATWGRFVTTELRAALARLADQSPQTILHLEHPGAALAGLGLAPGRTVYAAHNIEHRIWRDVAHERPPADRPGLELEWRKVALEEQRCWQGADLCLAVSEIDAETMLAGGARRVELSPNGTDEHESLPAARQVEGEPLRLLFVGRGAYWPYEHGLAWFATEVVPALQDQGPVTVDVVGAYPADPVLRPEITYHGRVPDVRPFYEAAHALVVPVFAGSGTRLKVIEASFLGRPVISTAFGVEGLPLRVDEHYARAETVADWVAATERLRAGMLAGMPARARAALRVLTWPGIAASLADTYRRIVSVAP